MIRYDPTLVDLISNFFVLFTNVKVYLYNYSQWVELSMITFITFFAYCEDWIGPVI